MTVPEPAVTSKISETSQHYEQELQVQTFVKQMLKGRLFVGTFLEQRYVESLNSYRDVVGVSSNETELIHDLEVVLKRLKAFYPSSVWIGITTPDTIGVPAQHCLWVETPDEVYGTYWYKIQRVKFEYNEVTLRLKMVRSVDLSASLMALSSSVNSSTNLAENTTSETTIVDDLSRSFDSIKEYLSQNMSYFFTNIATTKNLIETCKFLTVLLVTLVTSLLHLAKFMSEFLLKFMHEVSHFVNSSSPILIACINMLGKVIGGFYLLIAMIWRDYNRPSRPSRAYQPLYLNRPEYMQRQQLRALPPAGQQGNVRIVRLD